MSWQDEALCKGAHRLFTSVDKIDIQQAKSICAECPVIVPCRIAGEHEQIGVWGGKDESERRQGRRLRLGA